MKTSITTFIFSCLFMSLSIAQTNDNPTIAVANSNVEGIDITPEIASQMIRLELIKLDKYKVLDEFDMEGLYEQDDSYKRCLSKQCLQRMGVALNVDYTMTGSYQLLGNKIVVTLKCIDVANNSIYQSAVREFDNQEYELQRMTAILLKEMHNVAVDPVLISKLEFKEETITSNNVGRINNSGPRIGYGLFVGDMAEFATRPYEQGGLDIFPGVSMIGYQFEGQYVGTENFSALVEGLINISGLEQGQFLPSVTLMNGFRFGKGGWEFAFGPGFGFQKRSYGFFDTDGTFGNSGVYMSEDDWRDYAVRNYDQVNYPEYYDEFGTFTAPDPSDFNENYSMGTKHFDRRGKLEISTMFVFGFGRTFRAGALNIPVNVFYSSRKGGGIVGLNIGFNVLKNKSPMNSRRV